MKQYWSVDPYLYLPNRKRQGSQKVKKQRELMKAAGFPLYKKYDTKAEAEAVAKSIKAKCGFDVEVFNGVCF